MIKLFAVPATFLYLISLGWRWTLTGGFSQGRKWWKVR